MFHVLDLRESISSPQPADNLLVIGVFTFSRLLKHAFKFTRNRFLMEMSTKV